MQSILWNYCVQTTTLSVQGNNTVLLHIGRLDMEAQSKLQEETKNINVSLHTFGKVRIDCIFWSTHTESNVLHVLLWFRLWLLWPLLGWSMFRTVTPNLQGCCKTAWEATARPHLLPPSPLLLLVMQRPLIHSSLPKGITIYDGRYTCIHTCVVHCTVKRVSSRAKYHRKMLNAQNRHVNMLRMLTLTRV